MCIGRNFKMQTKSPKCDALKVLYITGYLISCWRVKVVLAFIKAIISHNSQSKIQCRMLNGEANSDF